MRLLLPLLLAGALFAHADTPKVIGTATKGNPGLVRPIAIAIAPGNVLLIADDAGKQVVAVQLPKTKPGKKIQKIANLNTRIGERMGSPKARVVQMAVSEAGDRAYLVVPNFTARKMTILSVDAAGTLTELDFTSVEYAKVALPITINSRQRTAGINDIKWAGDRIIVTATTNAQFDANIVSIPAPLGGATKPAIAIAETYHWSHRAWETRAPVRRFCVHSQGDKTYLFGGYICTPIVRFDLGALKAGGKLRGSTITDFGGGEVILDLFTYDKDGKTYLLANTMRRGCVRIESDYFMQTEAVNEKASALLAKRTQGDPVHAKTTLVPAYAKVINMVRLDDKHALVLHSPDGSAQHLEALPLP